MMKISKKGFTLVELLAIIVVLAVIALVTSPMIIGSLDKARKNTFKSSVEGMIRSIQKDQNDNRYQADNYVIKDGTIARSNGIKLSVKGGNNENGNIYIDADSLVTVAIQNGRWCAFKRPDKSVITIAELKGTNCTIENYK